MRLFSEKYGYTHPSNVIIREQITPEIQNAICSCYDRLPNIFNKIYSDGDYCYTELQRYIWTKFLNMREGTFRYNVYSRIIATEFLEDKNNLWNQKLDLIDFTIEYLRANDYQNDNSFYVSKTFIDQLNSEFKRLNFAYRIVNDEIVEITSEEEIRTIETALLDSSSNIQTHLNKALELYSQRPNGDYRNSIKESISAVEAYCRERTEEDTLGKALNRLQATGIIIPPLLKLAFEKLYAYTNQPNTGIRHALMDNTATYTPGADEALFMLVSCSAFINYLSKK
jgi:hypothetical protein